MLILHGSLEFSSRMDLTAIVQGSTIYRLFL